MRGTCQRIAGRVDRGDRPYRTRVTTRRVWRVVEAHKDRVHLWVLVPRVLVVLLLLVVVVVLFFRKVHVTRRPLRFSRGPSTPHQDCATPSVPLSVLQYSDRGEEGYVRLVGGCRRIPTCRLRYLPVPSRLL